MKIGLFGGTFDPIHLGHVDMIKQLCDHMALDKVYFIPAYIPPHKHKLHMTSYFHRLTMVQLAVKEERMFEVSEFESQSTKPSYTIHTVEHFKREFPEDQLFYIMGVDAFNSIEEWHHWQKLLRMTNFIVIDRPHKTLSVSKETSDVLKESSYEVFYLPLHTLPISSTMIRERLTQHESVKEYLNNSVSQYISENHLYQQEENQ